MRNESPTLGRYAGALHADLLEDPLALLLGRAGPSAWRQTLPRHYPKVTANVKVAVPQQFLSFGHVVRRVRAGLCGLWGI